MEKVDKTPNPGSDEAIKLGCICPVIDNGHGNEELGRIRGFVMNLDCPMHGSRKRGKKGKR